MTDSLFKAYNDLVDQLVTYAELYYLGEGIVPDGVYDTLLNTAAGVEAEHPQWTRVDCPTQRIGYGVLARGKTPHAVRMWSLANIFTPDELLKFLTKTKRSTYSVEPKYDGLSLEVVYTRGKLTLATTRGDGSYGTNVTNVAKRIQGIPESIPTTDLITVFHGEVVLAKAALKKINHKLLDRDIRPKLYASARGAASGILQSEGEFAEYLEFVVYEVPNVTQVFDEDDHCKKLQWAHYMKVGTVCPPEAVDYVNVALVLERGMVKRDSYRFEIDGFVIKMNDLVDRLDFDFTRKYPKWAIAYKFEAAKGITEVEDIIFQVSGLGNLNPVAKLKPVTIGGVVVTSANLFNMAQLKLLNLWVGDKVEISRVADVNNQITQVFVDQRSVDASPPEYPTHCPSCTAELTEVGFRKPVLKCPNTHGCKSQVLERLKKYLSPDGINVQMSKTLLGRLFDIDLVKSIPDLHGLTELDLERTGLSAKMSATHVTKLKASLKLPSVVHLAMLGIPGVSYSTAQLLMREFTFQGMIQSLEDGNDVSDLVGTVASAALIEYVYSDEGGEILDRMNRLLEV